MKPENKYLQIEGIVDKHILHQLTPDKKYTKSNTKWLFVDYAPGIFERGAKFDVILEGEEKRILPKFFNIRLLDIIDQFGNHLDNIPAGWKTICRFEFSPSIPKIVSSLPTLMEWGYNRNSLKIARHQDLVIDSSNISRMAYAQVLNEIMSFAAHTASINQKDFMSDILKIYQENKEEINEKMPANLFKEVEKRMHATDH